MKRESTVTHWEKHWKWKEKQELTFINEKLIQQILSLYGDIKDIKILEVGAGTGRDSIYLAKLGADVTCLDYSSASLKLIKEKSMGVNIKLIETTVEEMPFKDESFDIVFSQGLVEHFKNPYKMMHEQVRILKNDGCIIVDVPAKYHPFVTVKHILIYLNKWFAGWETEYNVNEIKELFERIGIEYQSSYPRGYFPYVFEVLYEYKCRITNKIKSFLPEALILNFGELGDWIESHQFVYYFCMNIGVIGNKTE